MAGFFIDLFDEHISQIRCVDVGAMMDDDEVTGGRDKRMKDFFQHPKVTVIGFEPQEDQCEELNKRYPNHQFLPYALGDGKTHTFHSTKSAQSSSFFSVDRSIIEPLDFPDETFEVRETSEMETVCLDDVFDAIDCDFLKLDAEGSELMILENAGAVLANCTVAQVEVSFLPYRLDAPVFRDVDQVISKSGFLINSFGVMGANFKPWGVGPGSKQNFISQTFIGDVFYVKDFRTFADMPTPKLFRAAALIHDIYRAYDLCAYILRIIDAREHLETEKTYGGWFNS